MTLLPHKAGRALSSVLKLAPLALAIAFVAPCAPAQDQPPPPKPPEAKPVPEVEETLYVHNATAMRDLNDVQTALRNMLPRAAMYGIQSQNAIAIRATTEDMATAKRMLSELDRPRKAYRVTYTITNTDDGKPAGTQHYSLIVLAGEKATLKQGSRVPLVTGMQNGATPDQNAQVQYMDVGLNIDSSIDGERLRSKVEQSGVSDEKSGLGAQDPVVHQVTLDGVSNLAPGKPTVLGSLDMPGSTRHQEIAVTTEPLP